MKNTEKKFKNKKEVFKENKLEKFDTQDKSEDQIEGRNSVIELLESNRAVNKIYIAKGEKHGSINKIIALAKEKKIIINEIDRAKINQMSQTDNNQLYLLLIIVM